MGLHKFCFTVSDTLVSVNSNTSGTCALHKYTNEDSYDFKHFGNNYLRILWEKYIVRLYREKEHHAFSGMMLSELFKIVRQHRGAIVPSAKVMIYF